MTAPKPRSAFLPIMLLVLGLVFLGVLLVRVPLVDCVVCQGLGTVTKADIKIVNNRRDRLTADDNEVFLNCWYCLQTGRITLVKRVLEKPSAHNDLNIFEKEFYRQIKRNRQSIP